MIADGWGDEDEDDLGSLDEGSAGIADADGGAAKVTDVDDDGGGGGDAWGFDDDGIVEDDDDDDDGVGNEADADVGAAAADPPPPPPTQREQQPVAAPPTAHPPPQQQRAAPTQPPPPPQPRRPATPPPQQHQQQEDRLSDPAAAELHASLLRYLHDLGPTSPLLASLNAVLDAEYSTPEAASELREYYQTRPELRRYTLEKEVTRMEYRVWVDGDGGEGGDGSSRRRASRALTTVEEIHARFGLPEGQEEGDGDEVEELLLRASNQSMLADALSAIAGEDRIVRAHSFLASAVAKRCVFDVELRKDPILPGGKRKARGVGIKCELVVSVPAGGDDDAMGMSRLDLATLEVGIKFVLEGPRSPRLSYELLDLRPLLDPASNPADDAVLRAAALSLARDLAAHPDFGDPSASSPSSNPDDVAHMSRTAHERLRDNFLSAVSAAGGETQIGAGLRSAWGQVDAVANVTGKLEFFSGAVAAIGAALPSAEEMEAAERDSAAAGGRGGGGRGNNNYSSEHAPSGRAFLDRMASSSSAGSGGGGGDRNSAAAQQGPPPTGRSFLDRLAGGGVAGGASAAPAQQQQGAAFPRPPQQQEQELGPRGPPASTAPQESRGRSLLERLAAGDASGGSAGGAAAGGRFPPPQQQARQAPTPGSHPSQMHQTPQQPPQQAMQQQQQQQQESRPQMSVGSGLTPAQQQQQRAAVTGIGSGLTPAPARQQQQRPAGSFRPGDGGGAGTGLTPAGSFPRPQPGDGSGGGAGTGLTPEPFPQQRQQVQRGPPLQSQGRAPHPQHHPHGGAKGRPSAPSQAPARGRPSAPAPLIGGFLISGLTRLANAAALPNEADIEAEAAAYGRASRQEEEGLTFYRSEVDTPEQGLGPAPLAGAPNARPQQQAPLLQPQQGHPPPSKSTPTAAADLTPSEVGDEEGEGGGWSDDDDLDLDERGGDDDGSDNEEAGGSSEPGGAEVAPPSSCVGRSPSRGALMASTELSTTSGAGLAASMETVNIGGNNNYGSAASPPTSGGGGTTLGGIGDSGHFVSPPRSPRPGGGRALPRAPDTSGSWSEVSEASAGDFVIVDASDEDGIIPTRRRWVPRRLREAVAAGVVVSTAGGALGSAPGTTGGRGGSVPGRMLPA